MRIKIKEIFSKREVIIAVIIFVVIVSISVFTLFSPNYYSINSPVRFDIKKGETFTSVVDRLYSLGIIPSKTNMRIAAFITGAETRVRAARYHMPNGLSYLGLLDLFISGECDFARKIRIRDGQTIGWLANKLERIIFIDSSEFVGAANDIDFINELDLNQNSFEGYLFSKEYDIYERSSPKEAIRIFYKGFNDFMVDSLIERAGEIGFSIHEILTLASIVKGETDHQEEMPRIAGVYHNRLRIGMKLQADPTIQYLLPGGWRRLLYKDLEIESPYNTYKYAGLPPGPINNPGASAILAALYPEENKYLYFVADGSGKHRFSKTHSGHINNVRKYKAWLREQNNNKIKE